MIVTATGGTTTASQHVYMYVQAVVFKTNEA